MKEKKYKGAMREIMTKAKYYIDNPNENPNDVFDYERDICGYCGDEMGSLSRHDFCSDNCWNGYAHETFRKEN